MTTIISNAGVTVTGGIPEGAIVLTEEDMANDMRTLLEVYDIESETHLLRTFLDGVHRTCGEFYADPEIAQNVAQRAFRESL